MNIHIRIAVTAAYVLMTFVQQFMDAHAPLGLQMAIMLASVLLCGILVDDDYSLFAARWDASSARRVYTAASTEPREDC